MSQQQYSDEDLAYHDAGHTIAAPLLGRTMTTRRRPPGD
jgi:hypothetical protein